MSSESRETSSCQSINHESLVELSEHESADKPSHSTCSLRLWDGLTSSDDRILVLGATNRPTDIDSAILRRMPKRYPVALPNATQREAILKIFLKDVPLDKRAFDLQTIIDKSAGMSGSDLKEICRNAAMIPVREYLRSKQGKDEMAKARDRSRRVVAGEEEEEVQSLEKAVKKKFTQTRALRTDDFFRKDGVGV